MGESGAVCGGRADRVRYGVGVVCGVREIGISVVAVAEN